MIEQSRAPVPGHRIAAPRDIVAVEGARGNAGDIRKPETGSEGQIVAPDALELALFPVDHIHFVDDNDDIANAEERDDLTVAPCLGEKTLARVDEQNRQVGGRGTNRHVAGVLLMAGRIRDDELTLARGEIAVG